MISNPQVGDMVIRRTHHVDVVMPYGVSYYEGEFQFLAVSHDAARHNATNLARDYGLDLWDTDDDLSYSCVARFRRAPSRVPSGTQREDRLSTDAPRDAARYLFDGTAGARTSVAFRASMALLERDMSNEVSEPEHTSAP